jgi:hypothetical protein
VWNLTEVQSFDIVPEGKHPAHVVKVEFKTSKAGAEYLSLTMKTPKGNVFPMMNINHPGEKVRNIALAELKRMLTAGTNLSDFNFTTKEQLAEALYLVKCDVMIKHQVDDYGTKAVVKGYFPSSEPQDGENVSEDDLPF